MPFLSNVPPRARAGLLVGAVLVLAGFVAAMWWLVSPSYQMLFGNLREADAAEIAKSLDEWKVPYRFADEGASIEVPKDKVYDVRMKLVSAGVPKGGHVGFELFDDADFGVTEFAQRVNYQRAMQGELERSIAALPGVESVRVHLTIRRPGLFIGPQDGSKASVALAMAPGEALQPAQVAGIRNLVASAVEGLDPSAVVVLGPGGVLAGGGTGATAADHDTEQSAFEGRIRNRVGDLLSQVFHLRDFRVSVDARMNFDQVHRVSERLIAQGESGNGLLTRRRSSHSATAAAEGAAPTQQQDDIEYAHGSEREEVALAPGRIERLSIAVLVPSNVDGTELARLRRLITAAAGLDEARGDRLEIGAIDAATVAPVAKIGEASGASDAIEPSSRGIALPSRLWLALAGMAGLLLGWAIAALTRPARPSLRADEREAVLARMRAWLAEGEGA